MPRAGWRYGLSITLSGRTATGQIKVALFGNKGNTCQVVTSAKERNKDRSGSDRKSLVQKERSWNVFLIKGCE